jgi:hypothetical protein
MTEITDLTAKRNEAKQKKERAKMSDKQRPSDLHELIATTSIRAFQHGQREERRLIANLIETYSAENCSEGKCNCVSNQILVQMLRGNLDG